MILQKLRFTLQNFRNRKLFTFVNITGLTIGIVAASYILIYINYELSFDRFHKNSERIFRVYSTFTMGGSEGAWVQTPNPLGPFLQNKFPEIEKAVRITKLYKALVSTGDKNFYEDRIIMADSTIFDVFTLPLVVGNPAVVLTQPNGVVISESTAAKYFGKTDPIGKNLRFNRSIDMTVTGIMKNIPGNTHLQFDMMIPMSAAKAFYGNDFLSNPMNTVTNLYLLTNQTTSFESLEKSISGSTKEYDGGLDFGDNKLYHIQSLESIYLHSKMGGEFSPTGDIKSIYILGTVALLILVIACINYINLSFSINSRRRTELGMRRIMGSGRRQLIILYLSDASFLVGISVIISALIIISQLPWYSRLVGSDLSNYFSIKRLIPWLAILFILITAITGLASGWISSRIGPMDIFRKPSADNKNNIGTQGTLVLFQFGISIILITASLFVYRQMSFIRNKNLGFSKDQLIIMPLDDNNIRTKILSIKQELTRNPNILSASVTSDLPGEMKWVASINYEGANKQNPETMAYLEIDNDFIRTYGIYLKEGYMPGDTSCPYTGTHFLLNESAVKKLGWEEPIGKQFSIFMQKAGFVTGVIKDFNFKSLSQEIEPLFLYVNESNPKFLAAKLDAASVYGSVQSVQKIWNKMVPDSPFEYFFYDNFYDQLYRKESSFGNVIFIFSTIAILIACMGLFSLAAFFSEKRTKEIGLRKVNGATIKEIMIILNTTFIKWVLISFVIACPVAWYFIHKWLQIFAYKTELSWWIFGLAGVIALVIAILTVSAQSWRAASRNPIDSLRYE
jgi:putative ABC transport system permease protein